MLGYLTSGLFKESTFVVNEASRALLEPFTHSHELVFVKTNLFSRFLDENSVLKEFDLQDVCVFSHGAPLEPKCKRFFLHINNALPFVRRNVHLDSILAFKMRLLERRLLKSARAADVVTVESLATKTLVLKKWGEEIAEKCQVLSNGINSLSAYAVPTGFSFDTPYLLSIGTYSYKRIDLVLREFAKLKSEIPQLRLVFVGTVPRKLKIETRDVTILDQLPHSQVLGLMKSCFAYITMSEIENCSISLLEAISFRKDVICSNIPSHVESLQLHSYAFDSQAEVVYSQPTRETENYAVPDWTQIGKRTLDIIQS